jgi:outer membrane protein assembly factor BamB
MSLSEMEANKPDYVMLPEAGTALAFDYTADEDIIRALDLESEALRWEQTGYRWSLEKYQAVGAQIVQGVIKNIGLTAGIGATGASAAANSTLLREQYVENLVAKVPGQDAILLKTVEELRRVDLSTGKTQWTLSDVPGSRLMHVEWLPSGDVLLAVSHTSLLEQVSGGKEILRLNPETGEVKWRAPHDADAARQTFRKKGYFLLQQPDGDVEAFRLEDGTKAYDIGMGLGEKLTNLDWTGSGRLQTAISSVVHRGAVYIPNIANLQVIGPPSHNIRKFDVATGSEVWASDTIETMNQIADFEATGNRVVARAVRFTGGKRTQKVVAWSPSAPSRQWGHQTPYTLSREAARGGAFSGKGAGFNYNLVVSDGRAYVATDTSVVAYSADDGTVEASASARAPGTLVTLYKRDGALVDLRDKGVSFHAPSDLSGTKPITFESKLRYFEQRGNYLLAATEDVLCAIDTRQQALAGTVVPEQPIGAMRVSGNLRDGLFATPDGSSLFLFTTERKGDEITAKTVHKYQLP